MKPTAEKNGITLIALVITIIVMLILVGVTITMAVNGGLFKYAGDATRGTNEAKQAEQDWATLRDNMSTDELIAKYTTNKAEDLKKLKKAYIENDIELRHEIEDIYTELLCTEEKFFIEYNNNIYILTFEISEQNETIYTNVELLLDKLDVTEGPDSGGVLDGLTIDMKHYYPEKIFEDFTMTSNDTSKATVNGYIVTFTDYSSTTVVLTGKTSGKTKSVMVDAGQDIQKNY